MKKSITAAAAIAATLACFGADVSDAKRMGAEAMNPKGAKPGVERAEGNPFKVLVYGNSIALHEPLPSIGWTNRWGMAASAPEKDFAHLVVAGLEKRRGARADFRVRNIAQLERNFRTDLSSWRELADDVAYAPDYVVIAIGENVPGLDAASAKDYTRLLTGLAKPLADSAKKPAVVMRSPFWRNTLKAACTKEAAEATGATYVDAGPLGDVAENKAIGKFQHGGVANHPGDLGMKRLADAILAGLYSAEKGRKAAR